MNLTLDPSPSKLYFYIEVTVETTVTPQGAILKHANDSDQVVNAGILQHRGLGIKLDQQKVTPERIEESINHIESGNYHKRASSIRKMFLQAGGAERAADLVEFYEEVGYDHLVPAYAKYEWSWVQYYNVDVYALLLCTALLCMYCTVRLCSCVCRRCAGRKVKKE